MHFMQISTKYANKLYLHKSPVSSNIIAHICAKVSNELMTEHPLLQCRQMAYLYAKKAQYGIFEKPLACPKNIWHIFKIWH